MDRTPTLKQLRYFAALADARHYRIAAERVGISQPSLSLQISNLEEILRLELVERGRSGAVLTPVGREVLVRARRIVEEVSALVEISDTLKTGMSGTIKLGSTPTLGPYILPNVVRLLHARFPALKLFIRDGAPRDLLEDLQAGVHDIILTQLPVQSGDVVVRRLFREPLQLAVARDHALSTNDNVVDRDLAGEDILNLSSAFTLHSQIVALCREVGANLRQDYEGTSLDALRQMAAMDMGLAFLPSLYVRSEVPIDDGDVHVLPFRQGSFTRSVGLAWRKTSGNQEGFEKLTEIIRSVVRSDFKGLVSVET
ncbi:LysR family transcriptional regulator [Stappia sp. GBMRC 2046]|uniref:LysR family transcriptional regulator n=2 Tax=Stappia sediminis TaxID=2692190 RepID=A0A7X3S7C9_9HYPH|nr:LysR family transcriptional regulator [Stappia sediminis]